LTGPERIDAAALERGIDRGLAFLADRQLPSGEFATYRRDERRGIDHELDSSPYATALIADSLDFCSAPPARDMVERTLGFLAASMEPGGLWRFRTPTGEGDGRDRVPLDADDTACISRVLRRHGVDLPDNRRTLLAHRDRQGRFHTWLLSSHAQDVSCVINAHVLLYLGDGPHARRVVDYLVDVVRRDEETDCDAWYPGPVIFHWALSRCAHAGIPGLDEIREEAVGKVLSWAQADGSIGRDAFQTALAALMLHNWRSIEPALRRACAFLLATQRPHGGWPRGDLFHGVTRDNTWGSEELTTGFCVEALARLAGSRPAEPPGVPARRDAVPRLVREPGGHLLHVGFPKAGSTTLQAWFAAHPQIGFSHDALGGYREAGQIAAHAADPSARPVRWRATSQELLSVPITAVGALEQLADDPPEALARARARACHTLRQLFAHGTILVVTRGFREAIASTYFEYVRQGGRLSMPELLASFADQGYAHLAHALDYDATLALYADAFGSQQVVVLPFELLRDDTPAFLAALEQRLWLDRADRPAAGWLNASLSGPELAWYPLLSRRVDALALRLGEARGARLHQSYLARVGGPRLRRAVHLLDRVASRRHPTPADVPDEIVERCRGRAATLRERAHYAAYAADYLNDAR
jgi:hypothetical protein